MTAWASWALVGANAASLAGNVYWTARARRAAAARPAVGSIDARQLFAIAQASTSTEDFISRVLATRGPWGPRA